MPLHAWTKRQTKSASVPNYGKLYVGKPALLKAIGKVKGKKILELGCGSGFWLRILFAKGAKCTGIDNSKTQIENALSQSKREGINYIIGDVSSLKMLKANSFDVVLLEHVILEVPKLAKIKKIMEEAFRVLKKHGFVVISDLHPFAPNAGSDNIRLLKGYHYFKSGALFKIISKRVDGKETFYCDYHWTLQDFCDSITDAGFRIVKITEPRPSAKLARKYPPLRYRETIPSGFMIKAVK